MTGAARGRSGRAGMEEKDAAAGLGFLGLDRMRLLLPLPLPEKLAAKTLRSHLCNHYLGSRKVREQRRWLLLLWLVIWSLLSFWILVFMNSQAVEKRREALGSMCDERARMLQDQFNVSMNHLQALAILISTFHHSKNPSAIDQLTFATYAERTAFERPLTSGVAYAVRVAHPEREQFERQQGWSIKKMYSSKKQSPGPGDAEVCEPALEYAPVIFAQDAYKHVISFDMLSGNEDRENVLRARESGKGVLTAPFKLLNNRLGVISTYTVYKSELPPNARPQERIQAAIGYLGGIFDIEALVDKLLHQLAGKQSIMVNVYDTTNESPISMYGSDNTGSGMCHISTLNFGDPSRRHEMHCRFMQRPPWPWLAKTSSFGTLVIALLIGYIFHATVKRIAKVEDDYQEMIELKKRAEAADIAKSQFLATVSHEIRTPMNGVLGMLQMLMDTDLDTTQQDYVRTAQASGKALVSLINEVLDQAKIESGKLELEVVLFDLRTVCDDILSLFCGKAQEKGLELAVYVSDQVPRTLIGDPGRIRQIITNLVGNSIKFTERGHIYLTVHVVEEVLSCLEVETGTQYTNTLSGYPVANRRHSWENFRLFNRELHSSEMSFATVASDSISLIISVEDTGVGIPFEAQSRVFTPFMQVGPSIARIHGGTGIGLSISKCLVGLMKGEIGFASKPHVGSTFTFTVVLTRGPSSGDESKSSDFKEINALVVDHRPVRANVTKYHLQRLGVQTELTTDLDQYTSKVNCGSRIVKLVLIDKETWLKESHSMPPLVSKLRNKDQPDSPKLFLLENPKSSVKSSSHMSREYNLNVILKPLRASMIQVSLRRALGGIDKVHCKNGVVGNSTLGNLLHKKQIIVVDDNIVNLKVAAGALKKYGAEVTCADSGKKAITLLKPPHSFDACFMDIQMPEMDGFEATKRIRVMERDLNERIERGEVPPECANVRRWRTPILAMTADVIQATHEQCLNREMDGYVSKPFEGEQLYREVARFFQNHDQVQ
ncbi:probable histidine kinase 3 [Phragmites australis]|uniref:probable histidine kinase 3 n=1 Tax=Phragmites australis TaxID=29695 RepID=UPI002D793769|nr:probable histidine kinase 3 [Phragmites australis]XP_062230002.1 probable histidine kinase 3 [Phragmites australis]XP_062230006.1 probable histidine kinase 3 [Phragmites australis]